VEGSHAAGDAVELAGEDARKVRLVLRMRGGEALEVVDSTGTAYAAILELAGDRLRARLLEPIERPSEARLRITLAQGLPKASKMDYVIQKGTEAGVAAFVPFSSERTAGEHAGASKIERWRRIARTAAQQSGRSWVPPVDSPRAWSAVLERFESFDRVLLAWEMARPAPLGEALRGLLAGARSVLIAIGPEGGLSHAEAEAAVARGAAVISLGPRILRTETAGLVAATAALLASGDL
jgi:16S rRNA (uracil1498-N3)-methyltransferase